MATEPPKGDAKMSGEVVKVRRGVPVHEQNPFMLEMQTKTRRVINKTGDMMMVKKGSGEVQADIAGFWSACEVDSTQFVKLYIQGVKALKELSGSGTKVFELLYLKMQDAIGKDLVYMSFTLVDQNVTPMSERTYLRGMSELIEKGFLAATPNQGLYWINPTFIWNGDRLAFVKEYRKTTVKKNHQELDTQPPLFPIEEFEQND